MNDGFSFFRLWAMVIKEFIQFLRDRSTFMLVVSLPLIQLVLFGLAINTNPKYLPTALLNFDNGPFARTLVHELENTQYFKFEYYPTSEQESDDLIATHQVLFALHIPPDFSRKLIRGEHPAALLEVDGTDPVSVAYALSASNNLMPTVFQYDLIGPLKGLNAKPAPAELRAHVKYNPSAITQYNIIPGLLAVVLTITFVMVASMALTRERERGTMEGLLSTPILPMEVIIAKAAPFIVVGYLQVFIIIFIAIFFFHVPMLGSFILLSLVTLPFILANLFVGLMISTFANSQLEASQTSIMFFMPSMLLSGFAFPFKGMPLWAQWIGDLLPMTHYVNVIRGIMLKGITWSQAWLDIWPILLFMLLMFIISVKRYRQTLD